MAKPKPDVSGRRTELDKIICSMIAADGPMPLDRFMGLALGHPEHGYYMGKDPFGRMGDFITAPEVSQIFGELIGIWCAAGWQMMDGPAEWNLIELGPGRGTLMADLLRACSVMPGMHEGMKVHLVEMSPQLKHMQNDFLSRAPIDVQWHDRLEDVPDGPGIIIANEFFDALPIQQLQRQNSKWHERVIGVSEEDMLVFGLESQPVPDALVPDWAHGAEEGAIIEVSPARDAAAAEIGRRLSAHMGAALIIDYGHVRSGVGDTLQAIAKHKYADVLRRVGEADITSHVDFGAVQAAACSGEVKAYGPVTQGEFLLKMGLREREQMLRKRADARARIRLAKGAQRLVAEDEMGQLFKVLALTHPDMPKPAPFNIDPPEQA